MLPADCLSIYSESSQHTARFKAGANLGSPAKTGSDNNSSIAVMKSAHTNNGSLCKVIPGALMLRTVVIKFIAPKIEDIPDRCKLNIAKSTEAPECDCIPDRGGYTVHPVPAPFSTSALTSNNTNEGGSNQKLMLFSRGKAIKFVIIRYLNLIS